MTSRRRFLAGTAGALVLGPAWLRADGVDRRVAEVVAGTIGFDMHNHVYPAGTEPHAESGTTLDLADELRRSGFTAVCASFVLDFAPAGKPGDAEASFLAWLTAMDALLARDHLRRALTLGNLRSAHDQKLVTIVQSVEGAQFIEGRLDRIKKVYARGVRHLQLLHERDDAVSPLADVNTQPAHLGGLTAFGADVLRECNRLGILVDLAHASHETIVAAVKVTKQPFVVSHTSLDSRLGKDPTTGQRMVPRLLSKEHARVIADAGGVIGVWTHLSDSLAEFVGGLKAMVDAAGIEHVGIGSDTDLIASQLDHATNHAWPGLAGGFFHAVVGEMLRQGFSAEQIQKIGGGNFCRVFESATSSHG